MTSSREKSTITELAEFACGIKFEDLPSEVIEESKRLILDSIGCALGSATSEKGKAGLGFARLLGGNPQARIIGYGDRVSIFGAAFANGELINALDHDAIIPPAHIVAAVLPVCLAVGESLRSSGKDLILVAALAVEISNRIGSVLSYHRDIVDGKIKTPPVMGFSCSVFGGTAAVGRLKTFDINLMSNALGLAGHVSPVHAASAFMNHASTSLSTTKYLLFGWINLAELTAAYLAELGHRGDINIMDGEFGYWRFIGSTRKWDPASVIESLGKVWHFPAVTSYKPYPHNRSLHSVLDCLLHIINENDIKPTEIDSIKAYGEGLILEPIYHIGRIESQIDAMWSVAHCLSIAAHRIPPGPGWHDLETIKDPKILAFMDKVTFDAHPNYLEALTDDPRSRMAKVEITARGKTFSEERRYPKGSPSPLPETFMTNDELIAKFKHNAQRILPWHKIDQAVRAVMELEDIADISELMDLVSIR